jgi:hypothetical protein
MMGWSKPGLLAAAAKPADESRTTVAAAAVLRLSELLKLHIAKLIDNDHLPLFATGNGEDDPDDSPQQAGKNREDRVKGVIDGLALDEDGLIVTL